MEPKDFIAIVAAIISLVAAAASGYIAIRGQWRQYFTELRKWADEACDALSEAVHACELDPTRMGPNEFFNLRHKLRCSFSSLLDRGRWFFPNLHHEEINIEREEAFRGLRQPALSALAKAYRLVGQMSYTAPQPQTLRGELVSEKRKFVSAVQDYLDPRNRRSVYAKLTTFSGVASGQATTAPDRPN